MSRPECIDTPRLAAMLRFALQGAGGSVYLLAIGALSIAADHDSPAEQGLWSSLVDLQAQIEGVSSAEVLAALAEVQP